MSPSLRPSSAFFALAALAACNGLLGIDDADVNSPDPQGGAAGAGGMQPPIERPDKGGGSGGAAGAGGGGESGSATAGGAGVGGGPPPPPPTPVPFFEASETVSHLLVNETQVYWGENSNSVRRLAIAGDEKPLDLAQGNFIFDMTLSPGGLFFVTEIGFGGCCMLRGVPVDGGAAQDLGLVSSAAFLSTNGERLYYRGASDTVATMPFAGGEPLTVLQDIEMGADEVRVSCPITSADTLFWVSSAKIAGVDRVRIKRAALANGGTSAGGATIALNDVPASKLALRGGFLYWVRADVGTSRSIMRTPTAGGASEQIVASSLDVVAYALDDSHVYYVVVENPGAGSGGEPPPPKYSLRRAQLSPTNVGVEDIVADRDELRTLALNAGTVYWAEGKAIMRRGK